MDLSKLPKLSQTPKTESPAAEGSAGQAQPLDYAPAPIRYSSADVWLSIAVGFILLLMAPRFPEYVFSSADSFAQKWTFSDEQGNPLAYRQSVFFWGDVAITCFAFVLILDGIVVAVGRRPMFIIGAFTITAAITLLNAIYVLVMMQKGYGAQIFSILAVAFGIYIAIQQLAMFRTLSARS
jgi:hypothetical protein